ncbi:MAG: DNA methyltransferase [Alphaproteobacteria bacterium]
MHHPLVVEELPTAALCANPRNARTHPDRQIAKIAGSITEFGFTNPVLIDENDVLIAGHGRLEAAKRLGIEKIPTIRTTHLSPAQKRALALADNKIALEARWDIELLSEELEHLASLDLDFDVEITGFETAEIDLVISGQSDTSRPDPADAAPEIDRDKPSVTRDGDLWITGDHRVLCGNALDLSSYQGLLGDERAQMAFTDPPYNVSVDGHVCGLGKVKHREFQMASGEMSPSQYTAFLETAFRYMANASADGSIHFIFMDWRHLAEILRAGAAVYGPLKALCIWNKSNAGMGSLYRSKHELVLVFKNGKAPHINNVELGKHGRYRTSVWDYAGVNTFKRGRREELSAHPTVKPIALVADAIRDCSRHGGIILDPFGGSGTTLLAAERTGRRARLIEIDAAYVDVTIERWQKMTGGTARLAATDQTFGEVARERQE